MDLVTLALAKKYTKEVVNKAQLDDIELDKTLTKEGAAADAKAVGDAIKNLDETGASYIQTPSTAKVGQSIIVSEVDENSKPLAWETVDLPVDEINEITSMLIHKRYFDITKDGVISLKPDYRGTGSATYPDSVGNGLRLELPVNLIIPDNINGIQTTALAPGMFQFNEQIKEITLPNTITVIPEAFCMKAVNLSAVNNTEHITHIGSKAFGITRLKKASFPNLIEMSKMSFASCVYLKAINIGKVNAIPDRAFAECCSLREVMGGKNVTSIGAFAFYYAYALKELPLLAHVNTVGEYAFFYSGIGTSLPAGGNISPKAFPTVDNNIDFWTGVPYVPCQNRLTTKLSQVNPAWKDESVLLDNPAVTYAHACALFVVMHIHSAISGRYYSDPRDFIAELASDPELSQFLYEDTWPGVMTNVAPMFEKMGYRTKAIGIAAGDDLTAADYKELVDALASGAYVYAQVGRQKWWEQDYYDGGHAVAIYGINELGEARVLDCAVIQEYFRESGFEPDVDIYTYTMPYQNMVGPSSDFVIVYPTASELQLKPHYEKIKTVELTEEISAVNISGFSLDKFILYITIPVGATAASGGVTVYKNGTAVWSPWLNNIVTTAEERNMTIMGENKEGIAFIDSIAPAASNSTQNRNINRCPKYIEGDTPFTQLKFSLSNSNIFPIGTVFELWGVPFNE